MLQTFSAMRYGSDVEECAFKVLANLRMSEELSRDREDAGLIDFPRGHIGDGTVRRLEAVRGPIEAMIPNGKHCSDER